MVEALSREKAYRQPSPFSQVFFFFLREVGGATASWTQGGLLKKASQLKLRTRATPQPRKPSTCRKHLEENHIPMTYLELWDQRIEEATKATRGGDENGVEETGDF